MLVRCRGVMNEVRNKTNMRVKQHIREYKRELVLERALELFTEKGFQRTTIDDIGASLGVTKPFIYTYFDSKYSILEQLYDRAYDELFSDTLAILNQKEGTAPARLKKLIAIYVEQNVKRQKLTAMMLEEEKNLDAKKLAEVKRKHREFDMKLARLIEEGVKAGEFHVEDAKLVSLAISGMVRWIHRWYSPKGRLTVAELSRQMSDLALNLAGYRAAK
jgi:AcrR family transcriptional regulator